MFLNKLAEDSPEHNDWIRDVLDRIVDLANPFQIFYYYNPIQKGSYSIKKVLPAITGKGYSDLEINNGEDVSVIVKWFKEGEGYRNEALKLQDRVINSMTHI